MTIHRQSIVYDDHSILALLSFLPVATPARITTGGYNSRNNGERLILEGPAGHPVFDSARVVSQTVPRKTHLNPAQYIPPIYY